MSKARRRETPAGNKPPPDDGMPQARLPFPDAALPAACPAHSPALPASCPGRVQTASHQPREGNRNRCNQKIKYHLQPSLCVADSGQKRFFRLIKGQPLRAALRIHIGFIFQQKPKSHHRRQLSVQHMIQNAPVVKKFAVKAEKPC